MSRIERLYGLLLRLYPPGFRERFGAEMRATFHARWRRPLTPFARLGFLVGALCDLLLTACRERVDERRQPARTPLPSQPAQSGAMDRSLQDVRYALRSLGRRPGFVVAVTLTLALGIGANTAVFSLVDATLLHPLPVEEPQELVAIYHALESTTRQDDALPYPLYEALDRQTRTLSGLAGFRVLDVGVRVGPRSEQMQVAAVSGDYFQVLGIRPQAGRLLAPHDEGPPGTDPVVVLSDAAWSRLFGRDPGAIGTTIHAGGFAYTIVGVAPEGFRGTQLASSPQLYFPLTMITSIGEGGLFSGRVPQSVFTTTAFGWVYPVGRLQDGNTRAQAQRELNAATTAYWRDLGPEAAGRERLISPITAFPVVHAAALADRDDLVRFVAILLAVVALTLLVTCVNVANLMLLRSTDRSRELALRMALGARRVRIVHQLFVESLILALLGAVTALVLGLATTRLLSSFTLPGEIALNSVELGLDGRVLAFTTLIAIFAALIFGLLPAIRASQLAPGAALRTHCSTAQRRSRGVLVAAQVAMSLLLLVGATLFVRSLQAGLATDLGFDPEPLAAVTVNLRVQGYDPARERSFVMEAVSRARRLPGVTAAAAGSVVPLAEIPKLPFTPLTPGTGGSRVQMGFNVVSPGYFDVLGVPLIDGRDFADTDQPRGARVAIVNEAAARVLSPDAPILGRTVRMLGTIEFTIVGIAHNTRMESVRDESPPILFAHVAQNSPPGGDANVIVRSASPRPALRELQAAIRAMDPNLPLRNARRVAEQLDIVLMPQRFGATLLGVFAFVALCVSAVGIYGVVAYGVSQRRAELGIRIALGAGGRDIARAVAFHTMFAVAAGMLVGTGAALLATRGIERFLYGITRLDPAAFASAAVLLVIAAAVGCWGPVRRAVAVDPLAAIRSE